MKSSHFSTGGGAAAVVVVVVLLVASRAPPVESVTCNAYQLLPCAGVIMKGGQPSVVCCAKLKEQQPCLCKFLKDPSLRAYVNSPNTRRVATICKVPYPQC